MSLEIDKRSTSRETLLKRTDVSAPAGLEEAQDGFFVQRALAFLATMRSDLGLEEGQPAEFGADPRTAHTSSNATAVHVRQEYKGIPVFQAGQSVLFDPDGTLRGTSGTVVNVPGDLPANDFIGPRRAVLRAAAAVTTVELDAEVEVDEFDEPASLPPVDITGFDPRILAQFSDIPDRPTVLSAGPFAECIKASLLWFPLDESLLLSWVVILTLPEHMAQYQVIVDAITEEILYSHQLVQTVAARAKVHPIDGGDQREMVSLPRKLDTYDIPLDPDLPMKWQQTGMPHDWVTDDRSEGPSAIAHLDADGPSVQGTRQGGVVTFDVADPARRDQSIVDLFYYVNTIHDVFYLLGFREEDGNFAQPVRGASRRGNEVNDRLDARSYGGPVYLTASMSQPADGTSPIMKLGLVSATGRHTASDSTVVFHEYTHGVTSRLVGGPHDEQSLSEPQSAGLGEGWSDFVACSLTGRHVIGAWVKNKPGGLRSAPYDVAYPHDFGGVGTQFRAVHRIGEIWCATMMEVERRLVDVLGATEGRALTLQLFVDSLKLCAANPSFIDARGAFVVAFEHKGTNGKVPEAVLARCRAAVWGGFSRYGLGPNAVSPDAGLRGLVPDFSLPPDLHRGDAGGHTTTSSANPNRAIPDKDPRGVTSVIDVAADGNVADLSVAVSVQHPFLGDLRVSVASPSGREVVLADREGFTDENLNATYTIQSLPALSSLVGTQARGDWTLHVVDLDRLSTGILRSWSLTITTS